MIKKELNISKVEKEVSPIASEAFNMQIKNEEDKAKASEVLSRLNKWNDSVVKNREKITKPLNQALKEVRAGYKPLETMLEDAIKVVKGKIGEYQTHALEALKGEQERISGRVGSGSGYLKVDTAVRQIEGLDKPLQSVVTDNGEVKFRTVKKFEVIDVRLLPVNYLLADEVKIRKAMLEGVLVEGVRYWEEQSVVNSR